LILFIYKRAAKDLKKAKAAQKKPSTAAPAAAKKAQPKAQVPKNTKQPKAATKVGGLR
jgi:hypothetical protein